MARGAYCVNEQEDLHLEDLRKAASEDTTYRELFHHVRSGFPNNRYDLHNSLHPYWKIRDDFYCDGNLVLYGARMVIPIALRRRILTRLHDSHCGFKATKRARQTVYWPGIDTDILNTIRACEPCQILQPNQQQEPLASDDHPNRPFLSVSADFFSVAGKHFLVYVDRFSNWPVVIQCGVPKRVRTDGGPQFTTQEFAAFLEQWGVHHIMSTPFYPQSNGHAEAAVKVKYLILKTALTGNIDNEAFDRGLLDCDRRAKECAKDVETRFNKHARALSTLKLGTQVRIQDPTSKHWDIVNSKSHDYHIKMPSGRILWRNHRFLHPVCFPPSELPDTDDSGTPSKPPEPRRSERIKMSVQDSR
ncbi:uncharacterized protein K02A2.6-like [Penaeus japonicus]|uniref:uncharacterized protein K02A2.6-like n=1 Tax=Penaeus japonicus TaxID=27405 RepID=UPI001C70BA5F|nr:uncharacterized protein K02A2.6-like [Penaeus japonicus]